MLMNPSLMLEVSTAACLVKEEAPERNGWFKGSGEKRQFFSYKKHVNQHAVNGKNEVPVVVTSCWGIYSVFFFFLNHLSTKKLTYRQ